MEELLKEIETLREERDSFVAALDEAKGALLMASQHCGRCGDPYMQRTFGRLHNSLTNAAAILEARDERIRAEVLDG